MERSESFGQDRTSGPLASGSAGGSKRKWNDSDAQDDQKHPPSPTVVLTMPDVKSAADFVYDVTKLTFVDPNHDIPTINALKLQKCDSGESESAWDATEDTFVDTNSPQIETPIECVDPNLQRFQPFESKLSENYLHHIGQLNPTQQDAVYAILQGMRQNQRWFLIDSPPGVGKTYLISHLSQCLKMSSMYIAPTHALLHQVRRQNVQNKSLKMSTSCYFFMHTLSITFRSLQEYLSKQFWAEFDVAMRTFSKLLDKFTFKSVGTFGFLFVDEYITIPSVLVYALVVLSELNDFFVLFLGDRFQQDSITRYYHHPRNNYHLLRDICTSISMNFQMRVTDQKLLQFLDFLKQNINSDGKGNQVSHLFWYRAINFIPLHKLIAPPKLGSFYMTFLLKNVRIRLEAIQSAAIRANVPTYRSWFVLELANNVRKIVKKADTAQHQHYLLLVVGCWYMYVNNDTRQMVLFEAYDYQNDLCVVSTQEGRKFKIERSSNLTNFVHNDVIKGLEGLLSARGLTGRLFQFPLQQLFAVTTYANQGLTILPGTWITVNFTDMKCVNNIYMCMSRGCSFDQYHSLILDEATIVSCALTSYYDDGFFYRISKNSQYCTTRETANLISALIDLRNAAEGERPKLKTEQIRNVKILKDIHKKNVRVFEVFTVNEFTAKFNNVHLKISISNLTTTPVNDNEQYQQPTALMDELNKFVQTIALDE